MRSLNLSDEHKRDSPIGFAPTTHAAQIFFRQPDGGQVLGVKVIKSTAQTCLKSLTQMAEREQKEVHDLIIEGDPEVDFSYTGKITNATKNVYLDNIGRPAFHIRYEDVSYNAKGEERGRKPYDPLPSNINAGVPLSWTGKYVPEETALKRFVFGKIYQLHHINGLTFDFLLEIARDLEGRKAMMQVGAGSSGKDPLRFQRGGLPYRAFLRGRTRGDGFCLTLHLTNQELKAPAHED